MQDFGTKADNSPPPGGQLSAAEFNNLATENENAVLRSGQVLSGASSSQLATSMFLHGAKSSSFQDSGVANAYVATPMSGASGVLLPATYAEMNGAVVTFKASNANTGASTLNIGQTTGTLIGTKPIVDQNGAALISGAILATVVSVRYDSSIGLGSWVLLPWSGYGDRLLNIQVFSTVGSSVYTPTPGTTSIVVEVQGGGGAGGGAAATGAGAMSIGSGGTAGAYGLSRLTTGFSGQTVTVGAGGTPNSGTNGGNGGQSSFGAIITAPGGGGGIRVGPASPGTAGSGAPAGASASGGNIRNTAGSPGGWAFSATATSQFGGIGGASPLGGGGTVTTTGATPGAASSFGSGGAGASQGASAGALAGGAGAQGIVTIWEYAR